MAGQIPRQDKTRRGGGKLLFTYRRWYVPIITERRIPGRFRERIYTGIVTNPEAIQFPGFEGIPFLKGINTGVISNG